MTKNLPAVLRSVLYALRGGFLIRPFAIFFALGAAGASYPRSRSSIRQFRPSFPRPYFLRMPTRKLHRSS